jgi:uncharacterized membrane protein YvlD (DUF360 family)
MKTGKLLMTAARLLFVLSVFGSFVVSAIEAGTTVINPNSITQPLCQIYTAVHEGVFILGLVLMIIGAVMYALAHVMPGQTKGSLQGYGMGLILGGIVGVIIAELAQPILNTIIGGSFNSGNVLSNC